MPLYVDGFVVPVPKKHVAAYVRMATKAGKIWKEYGALDFKECMGEDLSPGFGTDFPKGINAKKGETVFFSWITFKSRAHRDKVNAAVMKDERMQKMPDNMPFDCKRMLWGGFTVKVDAS